MGVDKEVAAIFAAQTAIIATLVDHLAHASIINKGVFINELYALLARANLEDGGEALAAPIKHLIAVLEDEA